MHRKLYTSGTCVLCICEISMSTPPLHSSWFTRNATSYLHTWGFQTPNWFSSTPNAFSTWSGIPNLTGLKPLIGTQPKIGFQAWMSCQLWVSMTAVALAVSTAIRWCWLVTCQTRHCHLYCQPNCPVAVVMKGCQDNPGCEAVRHIRQIQRCGQTTMHCGPRGRPLAHWRHTER